MDSKELIKHKLWISISVSCFVLFVFLTVIAYRQAALLFRAANFHILMEDNQKKNASTTAANLSDEAEQKICTDCVRRKIDGVIAQKEKANIFPVAAIIENHKDARPQSGLARANFVIEAEAEAGITRFLAVFADGEKLKKIGPIRSARVYYVDWAEEFAALLMHCGGSPDALVKIIKDKALSLNEFYKSGYFWRASDKLAPHNVYTSIEKINAYLADKNKSEGAYLSWNFKDDKSLPPEEQGENIKIKFKTPDFYVDWIYNKESNDYARYTAGEKHQDEDGKEIKAKNIVVQYAKAYVIDDSMRLKMSYIGGGRAIICRDGQCSKGTWNKSSSSARTRFYDLQGEEFEFNAGTTWVEVVRPERDVEIGGEAGI